MKQRDKGIVALADRRPLPVMLVEPISERRERLQAIGYLDGEALQYEAYKAQRSEERPGMAATFEDFLTIFRMGQACERGWFSGAIRGLVKG